MSGNAFNRFVFAAILAGLSSGASAQATNTADLCETIGSNGMVTALLCPEGLDHETLAAAGRKACADHADCGAWIWTNQADIPTELPDRHDALDAAAVKSALAIWVNGNRQLIVLKDKKE